MFAYSGMVRTRLAMIGHAASGRSWIAPAISFSRGFPAISNWAVSGKSACAASSELRPSGSHSSAGELKPFPYVSAAVRRPSWNSTDMSLCPRFQRLGAFLGMRFRMRLSPVPGVRSGPMPTPPSPIPRDRPSPPASLWLWQVPHEIFLFPDNILS